MNDGGVVTDRAGSLGDLTAVLGAFFVTLVVATMFGVGGPVAIIASLAVATWRLKARGSDWLVLGLFKHPSWLRTAGMVLAVMILAAVAAGATVALVTRVLGWPPVSTSHYGALTGHLPQLFLLLAIAWTSAAFGEEMLFRGFLLTRIETLLGKTTPAIVLAVVLQALLFGLAHYKQGPTGMASSGMIGLVFGAFYARYRALPPLIIAHGLTDTLGLLVVYSGAK